MVKANGWLLCYEYVERCSCYVSIGRIVFKYVECVGTIEMDILVVFLLNPFNNLAVDVECLSFCRVNWLTFQLLLWSVELYMFVVFIIVGYVLDKLKVLFGLRKSSDLVINAKYLWEGWMLENKRGKTTYCVGFSKLILVTFILFSIQK